MEYSQEVTQENLEQRILILQNLSNKTIDEVEQIRRETYSDYDELIETLQLLNNPELDQNFRDRFLIENKEALTKGKFILWSIPDPQAAKSELDYYLNGGGCCSG